MKEGNYGYDFGDGWFANVEVTFVTPSEARSAMKKSDGFCGYDVHKGAALSAREYGLVYLLGILFFAENHTAARTAERLMGGGGDDVSVLQGVV